MTKQLDDATFGTLINDMLTEPGRVSEAFRTFHNYSLGNQCLAWMQCHRRGIKPSPIATFKRWKELGRSVRKGEKALTLCVPRTHKRVDDETGEESRFVTFTYVNRFFVMSQTDGREYTPEPIGEFDTARMLAELNITEAEFDHLNGNALGSASARTIKVSALSPHPHRTRIHEVAHVVLDHTNDERRPAELSYSVAEVEAEATAFLVCAALDVERDGLEEARGYVRSWMQRAKITAIPEKSAKRIFKAANAILAAGFDSK